ncbi:hypothetical protein EDD16DRAFT_1564659 [Pisolithus croceorrhizus]|nr:hypothetical protein EDD16DRAFT_1564659 [Pisolithus croceorrhizus]KAI6156461.1 hypothetical protein EDD17DRAFT_1763951 [Pisolithus thermaeus]
MSVSSATSSPAPVTPTSSSISLPSTTTKVPVPPKQKPVNVFSNDGSFLERFQRNKRVEEEEKRKAELALARKRQFADRFKNRGKRHFPPPDTPSAVGTTDEQENPAKKPKFDGTSLLTDYRKEVRKQDGKVLKDVGTGVRPLIK